jgi:glycosidase
MMAMKTIFNGAGLLGAAALFFGAASAGCMEFEMAGEIQLSTHVTDWRDEVIYQMMIDRFADGDAGNNYRVDLSAEGKYHGGDWRGAWEKLDYLEELGVTTLWISPVIKNVDTDAGFDAYHGYWAQDLYAPNPHFGDLESLRRLVAGAHERNMKVILDIVTNHMGQVFFYDINRNGEPDDRVAGDGRGVGKDGTILSEVTHINEYDPDYDDRGIQSFTSLGEAGPAPIIFNYDPASNHVPPTGIFGFAEVYNRKGRTIDYGDDHQLLMGDFPGGLKDLNTRRCDVKEAMVDAYARWVELTDLDGFRIDTVKHVENEFWRYFTQRIRTRLAEKGKTNFMMFGEVFDGDDILVGSYTKNTPPIAEPILAAEQECDPDGPPLTSDMLDSVFYFPQHFQAIKDVFQDAQGTRKIENLWNAQPDNYGTEPMAGGIGVPPHRALVNFLDNHDVPRFLYSGKGVPALHNALLFLLTEPGIPCIYYGTEQQFAGGNDPANREDLWKSGYDTGNETFQFIKKISQIRRKYAALRRGEPRVVWSTENTKDEEDAGIFAFERKVGDFSGGYALVVFNTNPNKTSSTQAADGTQMQVADDVPENTVFVDVLSAEGTTFTLGADRRIVVSAPKQSGVILIPQSQM